MNKKAYIAGVKYALREKLAMPLAAVEYRTQFLPDGTVVYSDGDSSRTELDPLQPLPSSAQVTGRWLDVI